MKRNKKNKNILIKYWDGEFSLAKSFWIGGVIIGGIVALMESQYNDVFNIGNPVEITVKELALKILDITNSNSKLINKNLPQDDPKQRKPDISKAKKLLSWEPVIGLETGLIETIKWIDSQL